jgi:Mg2+ and Co2+ transporter CorA
MEEFMEIFKELIDHSSKYCMEALDKTSLSKNEKEIIGVKLKEYEKKELEKLWIHFTEEMPLEMGKIVADTLGIEL